jgi:hypothetical protein
MISQNRTEVSIQSFSDWADYFALNGHTTATDLEKCRATIGNRYPEMVLWLARAEKLRPKVLADATYTAWLKSENPKKDMSSSNWTELFRLAFMEGHILFEVPDPK